MPTVSDLTVEQFQALLKEFFAEPEKRQKMSSDEIKELAKRLNTKIHVPLITETGEEKILVKIVLTIDNFLYDTLPNEFYDLIRSSDKGISDEEAKRMIIRLSRLANEKINIPYLTEEMEYIAIRFIIAILMNAARKALKLEDAAGKMQNIAVPSTKNPSDKEFSKLLVA